MRFPVGRLLPRGYPGCARVGTVAEVPASARGFSLNHDNGREEGCVCIARAGSSWERGAWPWPRVTLPQEQRLANGAGGALGSSAKDYYASLHRVAYYGDHTRTIRHLAELMGLNVAQEG